MTVSELKEMERQELQREFLQKLPLIHAEAVRLGLYVTGRALHNAVRASGWEVAGDAPKAAEYVKEIP